MRHLLRFVVPIVTLLLLPACEEVPHAADPSSASHEAAKDDDHDHHGGEHADDDHDHHGGEHADDDDHDHDHAPVPDDPATRALAARVRVIQGDDIGCATEALGLVDVHSHMHETDQALDVLKRRAAVLGAEAVLGVDFHHGEGGHEPTHLSGMAVRCRDLVRGRTYDVISKLDVVGKMGKEDDAFDELRARAAQAHADLVMDIEFHHGDGSEPTHVTGTAIRFRKSGS